MEMPSFNESGGGFPSWSGSDVVGGLTSSSSLTHTPLSSTLWGSERLQAAPASSIQLDIGCSGEQRRAGQQEKEREEQMLWFISFDWIYSNILQINEKLQITKTMLNSMKNPIKSYSIQVQSC